MGALLGLGASWVQCLALVIKCLNSQTHGVRVGQENAKKKIFRGQNGDLSVVGTLAAGAFAGMTSTLITYPLDVLRLRLAVEPGYRTMSEVALSMLREEGFASFYCGLGPSLIAIAPYIAVNFCVFDFITCHTYMLSSGH